jgi:hypothetical protein
MRRTTRSIIYVVLGPTRAVQRSGDTGEKVQE